MIFASSVSPAYLFLPFLLILVLGFEIVMLIDTWTNNGISHTRRNWWLIAMIFIQVFGAMAYFITDRNKRISL